MTKISLILPLYNAKKHLLACLSSILNQTFKDFECLLINDGSTDETLDIVAKCVGDDSRFVIINQTNSGVAMARNRGIDESKSDFIAFLDQDDMLHPQALEVLDYMQKTYGTDVVGFRYVTVPDSFVLENPPVYDLREMKVVSTDNPFADFFANKNMKGKDVVMWTRLYNKKAIEGIYLPKDVQPAEDSVFTLKVMHRIKSMTECDWSLLYYRDSSTSVMNQGRNEKYLKAHLLAGEELYDYFLRDARVEGKNKEIMTFYVARFFYKTCLSQVLRQVKNKEIQARMLKLACERLNALRSVGKFPYEVLDFRKKLVIKLFLSGHFKLARVLV